MIVHDEYEQRSVEWMQARAGVPTVSEFDQLLTPEFKPRSGEMPKTYLAKKLAEWWLGGPLFDSNGTWDMDQGTVIEEEVRPWLELEYGEPIKTVAFITTDDGKIGCSPDGLGDGFGWEIKSPAAHTHVKYLMSGELPKEYAPQVHGSMFVTGFDKWKFVSYRRHFPPLVLTVEADAEIQYAIGETLSQFLQKFEAAKKYLEEINGGPPKRTKLVNSVRYTVPEMDIIP